MTRKKALFEVKQSILTEWEKSFMQRAKEANTAMEFIINKIYDDFENRTCENCKWCDTCINISPYIGFCNVVAYGQCHVKVNADDGCNKWKDKNAN